MVSGREDIPMTLRSHPTVFFLEEGRASLRLKSSGRIIADFTAPAVLGIEFLSGISPDMTVAVHGSARFLQVQADELAAEVNRIGMWQDVAQMTAENARHVRDSLAVSAFGTSYQIVRHHLIALNSSTEEGVKSESFNRYISERSTVSRSTLHKIIKSLQIGQYINIKRGILIELRHLPENY
ncbi:helix-turn-helix domain-containing protein [Enterobacter asburiae]|nr:helix-turn-helix domain-containing protein [Enterobacter asburiae]